MFYFKLWASVRRFTRNYIETIPVIPGGVGFGSDGNSITVMLPF
jgi:hypothetical protein